MPDTRAPITTVNEVIVYENRFVTVYDDVVQFDDGETGRHLRVVESGGAPGVVALALSSEAVALVHTYRYPLADWQWGVPRGFAHGPDPVFSVRRELVEELGAEPRSVEPLVALTPNSGLLASTVQVFVARFDAEVSDPTDTREVDAVRWASVGRIRDEILAGELTDAFTIAALGAAFMAGVIAF